MWQDRGAHVWPCQWQDRVGWPTCGRGGATELRHVCVVACSLGMWHGLCGLWHVAWALLCFATLLALDQVSPTLLILHGSRPCFAHLPSSSCMAHDPALHLCGKWCLCGKWGKLVRWVIMPSEASRTPLKPTHSREWRARCDRPCDAPPCCPPSLGQV